MQTVERVREVLIDQFNSFNSGVGSKQDELRDVFLSLSDENSVIEYINESYRLYLNVKAEEQKVGADNVKDGTYINLSSSKICPKGVENAPEGYSTFYFDTFIDVMNDLGVLKATPDGDCSYIEDGDNYSLYVISSARGNEIISFDKFMDKYLESMSETFGLTLLTLGW